jgi:hypothetical protein
MRNTVRSIASIWRRISFCTCTSKTTTSTPSCTGTSTCSASSNNSTGTSITGRCLYNLFSSDMNDAAPYYLLDNHDEQMSFYDDEGYFSTGSDPENV